MMNNVSKVIAVGVLYLAFVAANVPCDTLWGLWNPSQPWNGDNMASTAKVDASLGRSSDIVHWFANWGDGSGDMTAAWNVPQFMNIAQNFTSLGQTQHIPMITWQPWGNKFTVTPAEYPLTSIISGTYDTYITSWATKLKSFGKPFFLRPLHEFDGNWYPWGAVNGNTAAQFKSAWIRIRNIFTNAGATNVLFVWCPTNSNTAGIDQTTYYPGDQYVDWIGIDAYSENGDSFKTTLTQYSPLNLYGRLTAMSSKPIMMAEFGVVPGKGISQAAWLKQAFSDIQSTLTQIKALVYFNQYAYQLDTTVSDYSTVAPALGGCAPSRSINAILYGQAPATSSKAATSSTASSTQAVAKTTSAPAIIVNPSPSPMNSGWTGPSPSLYYSFDSVSSTIADQSGNGNYGTLTGPGASSVAGIYAGAMALNQANGVTTVQVNAQPFANTFTIAVWVNIPQARDIRMKIASSKVNWNDQNGWQVEHYPSENSISFVAAGGSVAYWGSLPITYGSWFHVAIVNNGGAVSLYFNGALQSTIGVSPVTATSQPLYIASDTTMNAVQGSLDELYIFSAALTAQQVNGAMGNAVYSAKSASTTPSTFAAAAPTKASTFVAAVPTTSSTFVAAAPTKASTFVAAPTTSSTYAAAAPTKASTYVAAAPTKASTSTTKASTTSSTFAAAAPTSAAAAQTCAKSSSCSSTMCACGAAGSVACYDATVYCCSNNVLYQVGNAQCASAPAPTTAANTPAPTPTTALNAPAPAPTTAANTPAPAPTTSAPAVVIPTTSAAAATPTTAAPAQTCTSMFNSLKCRTVSQNVADTDAGKVSGAQGWLCGTYPQYCTQINGGGQWGGCNSVEKMSFAMNAYYGDFGPQQGTQACSFGGIGFVQQ